MWQHLPSNTGKTLERHFSCFCVSHSVLEIGTESKSTEFQSIVASTMIGIMKQTALACSRMCCFPLTCRSLPVPQYILESSDISPIHICRKSDSKSRIRNVCCPLTCMDEPMCSLWLGSKRAMRLWSKFADNGNFLTISGRTLDMAARLSIQKTVQIEWSRKSERRREYLSWWK